MTDDWEYKKKRCRRIARNDPDLRAYQRIADREWQERRMGDRRTQEEILLDVISGFNPGLRVIPQIEDGSFVLEKVTP